MMSLGEKYSVDSFNFFVGSEFFKLKELGKEMRERENGNREIGEKVFPVGASFPGRAAEKWSCSLGRSGEGSSVKRAFVRFCFFDWLYDSMFVVLIRMTQYGGAMMAEEREGTMLEQCP